MSRERESRIAFKLAFLFFAIIMLGLGAFLMSLHFKEQRYYATTEAVIVDIVKDTYVDIDEEGVYSETESYVYVDYEAEGVYYEYVLLNSYDITMDIGDVITVSYDKRDPSKLVSKNAMMIASIVLMGVGAGFGVAFLLTNVGKEKYA